MITMESKMLKSLIFLLSIINKLSNANVSKVSPDFEMIKKT